jgi:hypothetical protein
MKPVLIIGLVILLANAFAAPVARAQKTTTHYDQHVNFSNFKTFMFTETHGAANPVINQMILAAVEHELVAKGLTKVETGADVKVIYLAAAGFDLQVSKVSFGYAVNPNYSGIIDCGSAMSTITTGSLVIDLLDKTDRPIFRGTAKAVLEQMPSGNVAVDAKLASKPVNKAIAKIFKKYPKAVKGLPLDS